MQQRVIDAHWSLGMALAWVTYRTEQAVINTRDTRWAPTKVAIRDLLSALRSGKLIAHGMFEGERIPHPIEAAVWSTFEIAARPMMFLGHMSLPTSGTTNVVAQRMGAPQTRLLSATVPGAKVRKLWPAAKRTAAAATRCQEYLLTEIKRSPNRAPKSKADILKDCEERFGSQQAWLRAGLGQCNQTERYGWLEQSRAAPEIIAIADQRYSALNRCRIITKKSSH